jgi:hypothetical protein
MSRYLDLARRAARPHERHETGEGKIRKEGLAPPPADRTRASDHGANKSYGKPGSLMPRRDESDRSPDYRAVLEALRAPPYWLRDSYLAGYRRGTVTLPTLSAAVAAALGRSPYEWAERLVPLVERAMQEEKSR